MFDVNSKPVISLLSRRTTRKNKFRNLMAIGAILLTTLLFAVIFTITAGLLDQNRQSELRMLGGWAHGSAKFLSESEYEQLKAAGAYQSISYTVFVGSIENEESRKLHSEIRYGEAEAAESFFSLPAVGSMPEAENEIAMDTLLLEALGIPAQVGSSVTLDMLVNDEVTTCDFILCGYWEGDKIMPAHMVWISEKLGSQIAPKAQDTFSNDMRYAGRIGAEIQFSTTSHLEDKMDQLMSDAGLEYVSYGHNPAYDTNFSLENLDLATVVSVILVLGLILISGYLIIYNIFYISVSLDIQYYGLLKTIGTSGRQLKKLVYRQALQLSLIGIPLGLAGGYFMGKFLMPFAMNALSVPDSGQYNPSPLVLIFAALFSSLTLLISCLRPCRLAARISPVEAVRYTDITRQDKHTQKRTGQCTPWSMALANLKKNRKKVILVVCSLFLSLVLLNSTFIAVRGFDLDRYISQYVFSDFYITNYTVPDPFSSYKQLDGIDTDLLMQLEQQSGIQEIQRVYANSENWLTLSDKALSILSQENDESAQIYVRDQSIPLITYGLSDSVMNLVETESGPLDMEKWLSGDYVMINEAYRMNNSTVRLYEAGDQITLIDSNGSPRTFTVLDVANLNYTASVRFKLLYGVECILPESVYTEMYGTNPMCLLFDVDEDQIDTVEAFVQNYCANVNDDLIHISRSTYEEEFENDRQMFLMIGGLLSLVLGIIGILNFLNAIATSVFARQKELAMLQAIGMGSRQIKRMLIDESLCYIGMAVILTATVGTGISYLLGTSFFSLFWAFTFRFTFVPVLLCLPLLAALAIIVPLIYYWKLNGKTITDRLRVE